MIKVVDTIVTLLLIIAGLIWGIIGIVDFNLLTYFFVAKPVVQNGIYVIFGLAALWKLIFIRGYPKNLFQ